MKQSYAIYMGDHVTWERTVNLIYTVKCFATEVYHQEKCCRKSIIKRIYSAEGQEPASKYWFPGRPEDVPLQRPQDVP